MINYDSHYPTDFLSFKGSVLPRASQFSLVSAVLAFCLKWLDLNDYVDIYGSDVVTNASAFGIYTGALTFILVFHTSECYERFWHCATSMCTLRTQLAKSASSLVCFTFMSQAPPSDIDHYQRTVVALVSMIHAAALANVTNRSVHDFPIIGWYALDEEQERKLDARDNGSTEDVIYMWFVGHIIRSTKSGLLNIPPPILSRVFQEAEKALLEYNQVLETLMIPFPFPYAQISHLCVLLSGLFVTPWAMCCWTNHLVSCSLLAFMSMVCLTSLELISSELENPFGTDSNDLPVLTFQDKLNESLALILREDVQESPEFHFDLDDVPSPRIICLTNAGPFTKAPVPESSSVPDPARLGCGGYGHDDDVEDDCGE